MALSSSNKAPMGLGVDQAPGLQDELGLQVEQAQLEPDGVLVRVDEALDAGVEMVELVEGARADLLERRRIVDPPALPEDRDEQLVGRRPRRNLAAARHV